MKTRAVKTKPVRRDLIDQVFEQMERQGVSIRKMSIDLGIGYAYLHGVLKRNSDGERAHSPTLEYVNKILDYLGLELRITTK